MKDYGESLSQSVVISFGLECFLPDSLPEMDDFIFCELFWLVRCSSLAIKDTSWSVSPESRILSAIAQNTLLSLSKQTPRHLTIRPQRFPAHDTEILSVQTRPLAHLPREPLHGIAGFTRHIRVTRRCGVLDAFPAELFEAHEVALVPQCSVEGGDLDGVVGDVLEFCVGEELARDGRVRWRSIWR